MKSSFEMVAPDNKDLHLVMTKTNEPIEKLGVRTFEGQCRYGQLAASFPIEPNSDVLPEEYKVQRDVDAGRVNKLKKYWKTSPAPVFPGMTIFINRLDIMQTHCISNDEIMVVSIPKDAHRIICDGQGRTTLIKWLDSIEEENYDENFTISAKFIVTDTDTLTCDKAKTLIKQCFSDYHTDLKKPNGSISKSFNSNSHFTRLLNTLLELDTVKGSVMSRIGQHGKINKGNIWTYTQFSDLIIRLLNSKSAALEKSLSDPEKFDQTLALCSSFLESAFEALPCEILDCNDFSKVHDSAIFTKAIFAKALGFVGQSIVDEILSGKLADFSCLNDIKAPLTEKDAKFWIKANVTFDDSGSIKIIKSTERRIASLICRELHVYPCEALSI